jgi:glutathione-regulated potassium-efflux system ancillary protein KefG
VDASREQELLREHDAIVWQFPWHWYSVPGVLAPNPPRGPVGHHRFTMAELLRPLEATAHLCGMQMEEPLVLHSAPGVTAEQLADHAAHY